MIEPKLSPWAMWTARLSAMAQSELLVRDVSALTPRAINPAVDTVAYAEFRAGLSLLGQEQLDQAAAEKPVAGPADADRAAYLLFESPDGEWARVRIFRSAEGLARRIAQLEGEDVVIFGVFGIPLPLTKGPQRYLHLEDGQNAIMIPREPGGPCRLVDASVLLDLPPQDDGFLGPVCLAETNHLASQNKRLGRPSAGKASAEDAQKEPDDPAKENDEDEDEDDGDGARTETT